MASKTIPCKSCEQEVAKSAKKCPNCGQQLKTGLFTKIVLGFVILMVLSAVLTPSKEDRLLLLDQSVVSDLQPNAELYSTFAFMSDSTDIQRDNLMADIKGLTVEWRLPVYEVNKQSESLYRIQTSTGKGVIGTFIDLYTTSPEEIEFVEGLETGNSISVKGIIEGVFLRHIEISPAVLN